MGQPVVHWEIIAKDAPRLQSFYGQLFDWQIDANNEWQYGMVETGGTGGINGGIGAGEQAPGVLFYVRVEDLQAALDQVQALGGQTVTPPTEIPGAVTFALFSDPEGNRIGLVKE